MSHDNRFSKTNYLKTNLLKQIKKNIFIDLAVAFISTISISIAKVQKKPNTSKQFCFFLQLINKLNTKNRDNSLRITLFVIYSLQNRTFTICFVCTNL